MCGVDHRKMSPEQVVEAYLDVALNMKALSEKANLLRYTTGNLRASIEAAPDDVIRKAYIDRKYEIISYSVVERKDRTPRETEITFTLIYKDFGSGEIKAKDAATITTENTLAVVREDQKWLIRDVLGNKTSFDFPVSEESRITGKPATSDTPPDDEPTE
jgi:hypothetical protein